MNSSSYSKVLFDDEMSIGELKSRVELLDSFACLMKSDPKIASFLESPIIGANQKINLLEKTLPKDFEELMPFLKLLIVRKKISSLQLFLDEFRSRMDAKESLDRGVITFAMKINPHLVEAIKKNWQIRYGRKLELEEKIDPKLLFGSQLKVGSFFLDLSGQNNLRQLKRKLTEAASL